MFQEEKIHSRRGKKTQALRLSLCWVGGRLLKNRKIEMGLDWEKVERAGSLGGGFGLLRQENWWGVSRGVAPT